VDDTSIDPVGFNSEGFDSLLKILEKEIEGREKYHQKGQD